MGSLRQFARCRPDEFSGRVPGSGGAIRAGARILLGFRLRGFAEVDDFGVCSSFCPFFGAILLDLKRIELCGA